MTVYLITNLINGHRYVGQTSQPLQKRWNSHKDKHSGCRILKSALQKYGHKNFQIKVLAKCSSIPEMNHREAYYIKLLNTLAPNGYNLLTGGCNRVASFETRKKMSQSQKGIKKPISIEHAIKLGDANRGKRQSKEVIEKRIRNQFKKIEVIELGLVFPSFKDAWKKLNAYPNAITLVLNGKRQNWKGLTFRHTDKPVSNFNNLDIKTLIEKFNLNQKGKVE